MRRPKTLIYLAILLISFLGGAGSQYFYPGHLMSPVYLGSGLFSAALVFLWYRLDSDERRYRRSAFLNIAVVCVALLALPYYFFRTRGLVRGLGMTAAFLGSIVLWALLQVAGEHATYWGLQT